MGDYIRVYFDGAAGPTNPGYGGAGWAILLPDKEPITQSYFLGNNRTNNEAEYAALVFALNHGKWLGIEQEKIRIYGDSKLVISQVNGIWKTKKPHLRKMRDIALRNLESYTNVNLEWIPRESNELADRMSNVALLDNGIKLFKRKKKKI